MREQRVTIHCACIAHAVSCDKRVEDIESKQVSKDIICQTIK